MTQKPGQDKRSFAEELRAAAEEADMADFTLNDAICLKLFNGVSDKRLLEKLREVDQPDLDDFNINAHMHSKASAPAAGTSMQTRTQFPKKKKEDGMAQIQRRPISEREKTRWAALQGKFYRCGSGDHRGRGSSVQMDTLCNKCGKKVIFHACQSAPAAARAADTDNLPLEYKPDDQHRWGNAVVSAGTVSRPPPQMLL